MTCPVCGEKTGVIDSKAECDNVWRKRRCKVCQTVFTTVELEKNLLEKLLTHQNDTMVACQ